MVQRDLVRALNSLGPESIDSSFSNIGLYSYGMALVAYVALTVLAIARRNNSLGYSLVGACALSALWAGSVALSTLATAPLTTLMALTEFGRNAGWTAVLLQLISLRLADSHHRLAGQRWLAPFAAGCAVLLAALLAAGPLADTLGLSVNAASNITFSTWLGMAILALLLLEQYFRNSNERELWASKHLCVGLGILFAYDFFMYAEALLFRQLDSSLWQARGAAATMTAVVMAVSMLRVRPDEKPPEQRGAYLSRHIAFHTLTLMAAGIYLISMALAAYVIRYLGGSWGGVLQIIFLCAAGLVLVMLLFSGQIRARTRVWLSKNFFSYKYDYRMEWLRFTQTLASGDNDVPLNITHALGNLAQSPAGMLWGATEHGRFTVLAHWEMPVPAASVELETLPDWLQQRQWIIDLHEWRQSPDIYNNLELPRVITAIPNAWLVLPLLLGEHLQGIVLLKSSALLRELNWEDRDLLKVAGRQAASHLAQFQTDQALVASRQFEAFNRLSAYVIHDLKNILAQLSLVVTNAEKHKHNPAFVDDMIGTVSNSVTRMNRLMTQLRSGAGQLDAQPVDLVGLLQEVTEECTMRQPEPAFTVAGSACTVHCDRDRLHAVFVHLIHNAQDATGVRGKVSMTLYGENGFAIVEIKDDGIGMDEHFMRHRLFKPFDSTKGLTGMGIGAFESRDFIRSMGGDIGVTSAPGEGSLFRVRIPCHQREA